MLSELIRWDGHYDRVDKNDTADPGVAIWEQFKSEAFFDRGTWQESVAVGP